MKIAISEGNKSNLGLNSIIPGKEIDRRWSFYYDWGFFCIPSLPSLRMTRTKTLFSREWTTESIRYLHAHLGFDGIRHQKYQFFPIGYFVYVSSVHIPHLVNHQFPLFGWWGWHSEMNASLWDLSLVPCKGKLPIMILRYHRSCYQASHFSWGGDFTAWRHKDAFS